MAAEACPTSRDEKSNFDMPSRRQHTKSRHGCLTCKKRKVRCDMNKPICENCHRLERQCTYADTLDTLSPSKTLPYESSFASVSPGPPSIAPNSTGKEPQAPFLSSITAESAHDLELVHHFTTHTSSSLTDSGEQAMVWRVYVPRYAFLHRFLLYVVLMCKFLHYWFPKSSSIPPTIAFSSSWWER